MKHYLIFDTETVSLEKKYCYDIGYVIIDEDGNKVLERAFIVEQVWHNIPLFSTAYYAEKRPLYVSLLKGRKAKLEKFGYIMQTMRRDIRTYGITSAYAYNSDFDDKVFAFNYEYFHCMNPFDDVEIFDIRGYAHCYVCDTIPYKKFCEEHGLYTESGNISTTAEAVYRFVTKDTQFCEAHMALDDSRIETEILLHCHKLGAEYDKCYKVKRYIAPTEPKTVTIRYNDDTVCMGTYRSMKISKDKSVIEIKDW